MVGTILPLLLKRFSVAQLDGGQVAGGQNLNFIPPIYNILVIRDIFMVRTNLPVLWSSPDGHLVRALALSKIILMFRCEGS